MLEVCFSGPRQDDSTGFLQGVKVAGQGNRKGIGCLRFPFSPFVFGCELLQTLDWNCINALTQQEARLELLEALTS